MRGQLIRRPLCLGPVLLVPLLQLGNPPLLRLDGVPPCWSVLWLLPWALVDGRRSGLLMALALGLLVDALHLDGPSVLPALLLLGWWYGRIGLRAPPIQRSLNLGLLALLGAALLNLSVLAQLWIADWPRMSSSALDGVLVTAVLQVLITALLAPLCCSPLLLLWRRLAPV
ncbi:rod shape-determining protein MreD [Synechococcus sp. RSCCF101]|uniref:rod shape-determining protein MreD n=1 Tax=Synechococcus sp. RSCCF101 TaxID=2511069 RepID=UPI0012451CF1|nr:rod shape-determining protein MreD [Synechococcus sp. RSCCF101]QEY32485.1 rod shape-determining protein MreD [Synechococcus sp. RSCCF101]